MNESGGEAPSPPEAARILAEIAQLLELNGADRFRARAFASAARALEGTDLDLVSLARKGKLATLPGVGAGIASVLQELFLTGRSAMHEELVAATPVGLFELMRLPGLGTARIRLLHEKLGVDSLESLEQAARSGRIAALSGFGVSTQEKLLEGIAFARRVRGRRLFPRALEVAERLAQGLLSRPEVSQVEAAGAVRRRLEVVDRVDLVAASRAMDETLAAFAVLNGVSETRIQQPDVLEGRLSDGLPVRLRCVAPQGFAGVLLWETGSDAHLEELGAHAAERGMSLDRDGLSQGGEPVRGRDEAALYSALGLQYLPPELREGMGEVTMAAAGTLPALVELADLRGTFHCHTTASDGKATLEEMRAAAAARGWEYLGIADHSQSAGYAGGLPEDQLLAQVVQIARLNDAESGSGIRLFAGIESDILGDGSLDYPDRTLAELDYVVASVHSSLRISKEAMTDRLVRAVRHPRLTILGHPTGRLLLRREGYAVDLDALLEAAAEAGAVVEINALPNRLDLDWRAARRAAAAGVLISINPDAHSVDALDDVAYGVNVARKAGLEPRQILNCWPLKEVEGYFAERKQAG